MSNRARKAAGRADGISRLPRYLQVASVLRRRIQDGLWGLGDKIATLKQLEDEFDVARVTVRQSIELLQSEGLLKSHQGRGTFVTGTLKNERWLQLATDWESLIAPIRENVLERLPAAGAAVPLMADEGGMPAPAYTYIRSVQKRGSEPYAFARVHVATHVYAKAPKLFARRPALAVLAEMKDVAIAHAHQTLSISAADVETARHLEIAMNAPTAEARCVVTDADNVVIYVGEITYRGDVVRLNIELIDRRRG
ncbi:GntR family transcriptional regulator [Rhizobiales bacterium GAS191]|jgi:GntR family transcriptional regulator|nr:GntR family transcriptional regulator [Rhizobiales bacterium GAS188]SEE79226.1 GntR family transcriptional regulator [Rhizobiales bacterium GAS191]